MKQHCAKREADMGKLFDSSAGKLGKDYGIALVAANEPDFLAVMRKEAKRICNRKGWVSSDDLRERAAHLGWAPRHPNAWGAIFKKSEWEIVGFVASRKVSNHYRRIGMWRWAR